LTSVRDHAKSVGAILKAHLPYHWDGKTAILEMKEGGSRNWRQMEWIGFYFQFLCERHLPSLMDIPGPKYGNAQFDAFLAIPWDFKVHAINTSSHQVIVNDLEAIHLAIQDYGAMGLVLALGEVEYNDEKRSFQEWHQKIKGKVSKYVKERIRRGAWSRLRKVSLTLRQVSFLQITQRTLVKCGMFQQDFRNADGSPRRAKLLLDLEQVDEEIVHAEEFS